MLSDVSSASRGWVSGAAVTGEPAGGRAAEAWDVGAAGRVVVEGLRWRPFGRREPVLDGLHLTIPAGQRVLLAGPSGSGKSTLLRALGGLLEVADAGELSGTVTIDGVVAGSRPGAVGLVLQEPGAGIVAATVGRDVAFGPENVGLPRTEMPARVDAALAAVRLGKPLDTPTGALSGGQTQRLAIAGALALEPSVLLLDEPTAMLDPDNAAAVRATVEEVADRHHLTTVVVEHVLGPWVDFADRLLVLDAGGQIVADGPPRDVLAEHGDSLAAQGIWVPGAAAPTPVPLPRTAFGSDLTMEKSAGSRDISPDVRHFSVTADPGQGAPVLAAEHVRVERRESLLGGETRATLALEDATAYGRSGELTAIVGPSGSGKSTLLLALAGLIPTVAGRTTDRGLSSPDLARLLAWVPQWSSSTIVARTVLDEALVTSRALGLDEAVCRARAETLLRAVGLWDLRNADPRHLSGGEQRRLAVVGALVHQPRALLADEPTVGQDRLTWASVMGVVEAYRETGGAVVVSTHDQAVVDRAHAVVRLATPDSPPPEPISRRPLVSRAGPLSLLAGALLSIPAGIASPGWRWSLVVLAVQAVLAVVGLSTVGGEGGRPAGRIKRVALRMVPGLIGSLSVGWSTWLLGGHDLGLAATGVLRVLVIVFPSAVLVPYVDPDALGDQLAQRLHLPARPVVAMSAALQRLHTFGAIRAEITGSRRVRGLGGRRGPGAIAAALSALTIGLLVRSLGAAAELAVAMDARGFATATRRTWWASAPWRTADTVVVISAAVPALVAVLAAAGVL